MALNLQGFNSVLQRPQLGLLLIRLVVAAILINAGVNKFAGGEQVLHAVGANLQHIGINLGSGTAFTLLFGILAAGTQVVGGALLLFGLQARLATLMLFFVMLVATATKYHEVGLNLRDLGFPLVLAVVLLGLVFTGPGNIAVQRD